MRWILPLTLAACIPVTFSGSNVPTDHVFRLTADDIAAAESSTCAQDWVEDDVQFNVHTAIAELDDRGIKIVERKRRGFSVAAPRRLYVGKGFWDKPVASQAVTLSHELVHYCQRAALGAKFEDAYLHSAGRWRLEVPAYAQSIRTMHEQGTDEQALANVIGIRLTKMRDDYFLHDIDPAQYEMVTRRIWEAEL